MENGISRMKNSSKKNGEARIIQDRRRQKNGAEIHFYRSNEKPYGVFSNLYRREILIDGVVYPTAEHAYQAAKAQKKKVRDWILAAPSPALLAMAAHGLYTWDVVPNWSKIKISRMRAVLHAKFSQHPDLRALLLSTGNARLVEAGTVDNAVNRMWGEVNGRGKNTLGKLLMEIRATLRRKPGKKAVKKTTKNSSRGRPSSVRK